MSNFIHASQSLHNTASVLHALDNLLPPSPDISIRHDLSSLCSSGEIPVFLHSGIQVSVSFSSSNSRQSLAILELKDSRRAQGDEVADRIPTPPGTAGTTGTFGIRSFEEGLIQHTEDILDDYVLHPLEITSPTLHATERLESVKPTVDDLNECPAVLAQPTSPVLSASEPHSADRVRLLESIGSPQTPIKTRTRSSPNHLHRASPSRSVPFVALAQSMAAPSSSPPALIKNSPKRRHRPRGGSTATVMSIDSTLSAASAAEPALVQHKPLQTQSLPADNSSRRQSLPVSLAWLKDIIIELYFDQEGYRVVRPAFRLAGYTGPRDVDKDEASSMNHHLCSGQADFIPLKREIFSFHHAALETAPVFRRLTMKDDDSHDYISKQASLSLKSNGVYTVHGTESSHSHSPFHFDLSSEHDVSHSSNHHTTLHWRLDYIVSDKRTDKGKLVHGEKTITPLTFSCSPGLLHESHRKKIGFRHMVKKSFVPKLTAERVEVPGLPPVPALPDTTAAHDRHHSAPDTSKEHPANPQFTKRRSFLKGHRKAKSSQAPRAGIKGVAPLGALFTKDILHREAQTSAIPPPQKLKSNSSWDSDLFIKAQSPLQRLSDPSHSPIHLVETNAQKYQERHILPKNMLSSMLSNDPNPGVGVVQYADERCHLRLHRTPTTIGLGMTDAGEGMERNSPRVALSPPKYHHIRARRMSNVE